MRIWDRNIEKETVESVLMGGKGYKIPLCSEPQGEAIAIKYDNTGFYTVSEAAGEEEAKEINIPIYHYPISTNSKDRGIDTGLILIQSNVDGRTINTL